MTELTTPEPCAWTIAFRAWLDATGQSRAHWARTWDVHPNALHRWYVLGTVPHLARRRQIQSASNGLVRA